MYLRLPPTKIYECPLCFTPLFVDIVGYDKYGKEVITMEALRVYGCPNLPDNVVEVQITRLYCKTHGLLFYPT